MGEREGGGKGEKNCQGEINLLQRIGKCQLFVYAMS